MSKNNRSTNQRCKKDDPQTESISVFRNGRREQTSLLSPLHPQFVFYAESENSFEAHSEGLTEVQAEAAALDRAARYLINYAYAYLISLYKLDKAAAYGVVRDVMSSIDVSDGGKTINLRRV